MMKFRYSLLAATLIAACGADEPAPSLDAAGDSDTATDVSVDTDADGEDVGSDSSSDADVAVRDGSSDADSDAEADTEDAALDADVAPRSDVIENPDTAADLGGADADVDVGCTTDEECGDDKRCVDAMCVRLCGIDADCGAGSRCDDFVCVPNCESSTDCGDGEACADGACVPACASVDDCEEGQACVGDVCRDSCEEAIDCALGNDCVDEVCVPVELVCHPDDSECDGDFVSRCEEDGLSFRSLPCPGDQVCVELGGVGECVSDSCSAGTSGCFDLVTAWTCEADGSGRIPSACDDDEICDGGECRPPSDTPCLEVHEDFLDFGTLAPGTSRVRRNFLVNCGESPLTMPSLSVEGIGFELLAAPTGAAMLPGDEHHVMIRHTASSAGPADGLFRAEAVGLEPIDVTLVALSDEGAAPCPVAAAGCRNADGDDESFVHALTAPVGVAIGCDGSASEPEGEIEAYFWYLDSPDDEVSLVPFVGRTLIDFFASSPGTHIVELDVIGPDEQFSCEPARVLVVIEE